MLAKTPWLKKERFTSFWWKGDPDNGWGFCPDIVANYFDIPEEATQIRFVAYKRPAKDRVEVKVVKDFWNLKVDDNAEFTDHNTEIAINKLIGKFEKVYVECEWS